MGEISRAVFDLREFRVLLVVSFSVNYRYFNEPIVFSQLDIKGLWLIKGGVDK